MCTQSFLVRYFRFERNSMTAAGNVAQPALIKDFSPSQPMTCNKFKAPHIFQLTHQEMTELFPRLLYDTEE